MPLVTTEMIQAAFDYLDDADQVASQVFADAVIAEANRKSTKARLILQSAEKTLGLKEADAECHPDLAAAYAIEAQAVADVEWHRRQRARAEATIDVWRTQESSLRGLGKIV